MLVVGCQLKKVFFKVHTKYGYKPQGTVILFTK